MSTGSLRRRLRPAARARAPHRYDDWLRACGGEPLDRIDAACAAGEAGGLAVFRELDADLWALLLTREYDGYAGIRGVLPRVPEPELQARWNGAGGAALAAQGAAFYRRLRERCDRHGGRPLADARVLDFGCGWGRLTRMLARDVEPARLFGCDPDEAILAVCRDNGVPGTFARSERVPDRLPFDGRFDLAYAFSVFTHLSEAAHERCLAALHEALAPAGLLVLTVRPPAYAELAGMPRPERYGFRPHPGEEHYGEAIVTLPYVRERWSGRFELLATDVLLADPFQLVLTLRRRSPP
jgi:SAM-dependent methyltransferase